jgi:hypothetical protein
MPSASLDPGSSSQNAGGMRASRSVASPLRIGRVPDLLRGHVREQVERRAALAQPPERLGVERAHLGVDDGEVGVAEDLLGLGVQVRLDAVGRNARERQAAAIRGRAPRRRGRGLGGVLRRAGRKDRGEGDREESVGRAGARKHGLV